MNRTLWFPDMPGLHTITRGKKTSYFLFYRTKTGQQRRSKLGDTRILTLKQAKDEAKRLLAIVCLGGDPFGDRKAQRKELTVGAVMEELFSEHYTQNRFRDSGYVNEVFQNWSNHLLAPFGHLKISKVTAPIIRKWHKTLHVTPIAANRSKALLSKIFSFAEEKGYLMPGSNPCRAVPNFTEVPRTRFATVEEMKAIGSILHRDEAIWLEEVCYLYLLIFTGTRPEAVNRFSWNNVTYSEWEGRMIATIGFVGKRGWDEVIIPHWVYELLIQIPRNVNQFIFSIRFPTAYWNSVRKEAGCEDLRARDWRRTFGTLGLSIGISRGAVGEILNHRGDSETIKYTKLLPEARIKNSLEIATEMKRRLAP